MPSLMLHLKIGEEYLKTHKVENPEQFLKGCLAPDFAKDKRASHFGKNEEATDYSTILENKTDIVKICQNVNLDSDFNKGVFLHLITDDFFYKNYMIEKMQGYKEFLEMPLEQEHREIFEEYNRLAYYFYQTQLPQNMHLLPEVGKQFEANKMKYFEEKDIEMVIEKMSNLDLQKLHDSVLKGETKYATQSEAI